MTEQSKTCGVQSRTIENPKSKIARVSANVLGRAGQGHQTTVSGERLAVSSKREEQNP